MSLFVRHSIQLTSNVLSRKLTDQQRALLRSYAEIESETVGTINGIEKKGDSSVSSVTLFQFFLF